MAQGRSIDPHGLGTETGKDDEVLDWWLMSYGSNSGFGCGENFSISVMQKITLSQKILNDSRHKAAR